MPRRLLRVVKKIGLRTQTIQCSYCSSTVFHVHPSSLQINWNIIQILKDRGSFQTQPISTNGKCTSLLCSDHCGSEIVYIPSHSGIYPGYYIDAKDVVKVDERDKKEEELIEGMKTLNVSAEPENRYNSDGGTGHEIKRVQEDEMLIDDT